MGPAVVADLITKEKRGVALSVMAIGPSIVSHQSLTAFVHLRTCED